LRSSLSIMVDKGDKVIRIIPGEILDSAKVLLVRLLLNMEHVVKLKVANLFGSWNI